MSSTTTNYDFILPAVADPVDEDLWGTQLNTNFSSLDTILPTPASSKYGAVAVQNSTADGMDYITSQGTLGQVLTSAGANALPTWQDVGVSDIINTVYPVGSLYWNKSVSTNPGTLFGVGTWVQITDKFIIARGSTYTGTGGSSSVTLSQNNLPSSLSFTTSSNDVNNTATNGLAGANPSSGGNPRTLSFSLSNSGGGQSFSIIPTYQAAYCWERTA